MSNYHASRMFRSLILVSVMTASSALFTASAQTPAPTPVPSPIEQQDITPQSGSTAGQDVRAPNFPVQQAVPAPPLPDLTRLGVSGGNPISLSMNDAIRRALENNNDIKVARDDVRINEQSLRALLGIFDPVISFTPRLVDFTQSTSQPFSGAASSVIQSRTFQANPRY